MSCGVCLDVVQSLPGCHLSLQQCALQVFLQASGRLVGTVVNVYDGTGELSANPTLPNHGIRDTAGGPEMNLDSAPLAPSSV